MHLRPVGVATAAALALIATGCGGPGTHHAAQTPTSSAAPAVPTSQPVTPPTSHSAGRSRVVVPTLPPPVTRAPLSVRASISLPLAQQAAGPVATEAPDGAVFAAEQGGGVVWVVDGNAPPAVAEHIPGPVSSLAADDHDLYVATTQTVYGFDRASGNQVQAWALPPAARAGASPARPVHLTAAAGRLWVMVSAGRDVDVYRIDPASASPPHRVQQTLGALVAADGTLYYEGHDGHLVRQRPGGARVVGPRLRTRVDAEGGGVQRLRALAGGDVWVEQDAGQGLDASYRGYSQRTLSTGPQISGAMGATAVDTQLGPVWQTAFDSEPCPFSGTSCLLRLGSRGSLSQPVADGATPVALGPYPAVVTSTSKSGGLVLERLG